MQSSHSELAERVAGRLTDAGFEVDVQPVVGGLRPDLLVHGPAGSTYVVEVKTWDSRGGNTARAIRQADLLQEATGADAAYVVLDSLKRNYPNKRVVTPDGLIDALLAKLDAVPPADAAAPPAPAESPPQSQLGRIVFAAMPFDGQFDDTYLVAMRFAAERASAHLDRIDEVEFSGDIVQEIHHRIEASTAVIADLSGANPNVLYEVGYAHALRKPMVHISSTPMSELPFDVRNWNTISYRIGRTSQLQKPLADRLLAVLGD